MWKSLSMGILLSAITLPVLAQSECPYTSFWMTAEGQCIDLTFLTDYTNAIRAINKLPDYETNSVGISRMEVYPDSTLGGAQVYVTLTNQSNRIINISQMGYNLERDGNVVTTESIFVGRTVQPGQSVRVNEWVPRGRLGRGGLRRLRVVPLDVIVY